MISGRILPYVLLALGIACVGLYAMYQLWDAADDRADRAEDTIVRQRVISKIVKEYVHDIQYLPAPESVVAARVDRLCRRRLAEDRPGPDGAAAGDADHRRDRDFDRELVAAWKNGRQLEALQEAARAAGCAD